MPLLSIDTIDRAALMVCRQQAPAAKMCTCFIGYSFIMCNFESGIYFAWVSQ